MYISASDTMPRRAITSPQKFVVDLPMIRGVRVQMRVGQISLKGYWFEFLPTEALVWSLFQTSSGPEWGLWSFMCTIVVIGCNVASVQFGVKRICDSTPKLCSHKPEESTVLFCSAPLPPYSCWLTEWQQGRIYPRLQMTHCGFLGSKVWPKWSKLQTVLLFSGTICKVLNDCINSSALPHCHCKQL